MNYVSETIRSSAILTSSYVAATTIVSKEEKNQLVLLFALTADASQTSLTMKIEGSDDNSTFYQETFGTVSSNLDTVVLGEHALPFATGNFFFAVPIMHKYIKISVKGGGTLTNSLLAIKAVTGIV